VLENQNIQLKQADKITMAVIGLVVVAAIAIPVLTWFAAVTALLATIMANTMYFFVTAGALLLGVSWLWENRTALLYKWKNMARNVRRTVARENPIGTMDTAIGRFEKKLEDITTAMNEAAGALKQQRKAIAGFLEKATDEDSKATQANRTGRPDAEIARYGAAADRWREAAARIQPVADKLAEAHAKMQSARDVCIDKLEDLKNRREVYAAEYAAMTTGTKALRSFKSFFGNNPDLEMLQLSVEVIYEETARYEAEIDQFLYDVKPMVESNQLEKGAAAQKALDRVKGTVKQLPESTGSLGLATIVKEAEVVETKIRAVK
jgi:hypothetical protein